MHWNVRTTASDDTRRTGCRLVPSDGPFILGAMHWNVRHLPAADTQPVRSDHLLGGDGGGGARTA